MKRIQLAPLFVAALFLIPSGAFAGPIAQKTGGNTHASSKASGAVTGIAVAANDHSTDQVRNELAKATNQAQAIYCPHQIEDTPIPGSDAP